jgi:hypothetical protein
MATDWVLLEMYAGLRLLLADVVAEAGTRIVKTTLLAVVVEGVCVAPGGGEAG